MLLINSGANINSADINGLTILHYAVNKNNLDCARFLLQRGADKSRKTNKGNLAYAMATSPEMKQLILNGPEALPKLPTSPIVPLFAPATVRYIPFTVPSAPTTVPSAPPTTTTASVTVPSTPTAVASAPTMAEQLYIGQNQI